MPWSRVRALRRRRSFAEFGGMESRRSRHVTRCVVTMQTSAGDSLSIRVYRAMLTIPFETVLQSEEF